MNKAAFIFPVLLVVSGCNSMPVTEAPVIQTESVTANESDDGYYLSIAQELYTAKQYKQTYQIARKLADKGNYEAQYLLGYLIFYGQGVTEDKELGKKWIQKSADAGYRPAIEGLVLINHGLTSEYTCVPVKQPFKEPANLDSKTSSVPGTGL